MPNDKWYHGRLSRQKAEELVNRAGVDGSFVVRASESIQGAYALSVLFGGSIHTYRILPTETGLLAVQTINGVQQRKFNSITELITAYRSPQNGLACGLTNPVGTDKPTMTLPPSTAPLPDPNRGMAAPAMHQPLPLPTQVIPPMPRTGVKVMIDDLKSMQKPKLDKVRELPPLPPPSRDAPQKPSFKPSVPPIGLSSKASEIQCQVQERVKTLVNACPSVGTSFLDSLQQYCADGVQRDIDGVLKGNGQCVEMQKILAKEAGQFQNELDLFLRKIDVLRQLFDLHSAVSPTNNYNMTDRDVDLESFLTRLGDCKSAVKTLDKRTSITIKELAGMEVESMYGTGRRASIKGSQTLPLYDFEVKLDGGLKVSRQKLRVIVDQGKLQILKGDGMLEYTYSQVLQIVKNNKSRSKLSVLFEGGKKRDYLFESSSQREAFCQVMQLVRNMHSNNAEPDCISLFIGAWNMGDAIPPVDIRSWFKCGGTGRTLDPSICEIPHDIYVIGTQETGMPEKEWLNKVMETITDTTGVNLHLVAMDALWHIKIIILVKEEHKNRISHIQTSSVKTGIANTLGNKGAVAVAFQFGGTSLCFINAHLTSGNEKCGRRNQNYHDIMRALNLGHDRCSMFDLTNRFDHLFFLGDLNYRLEMDVHEIFKHIEKKDLSMLYKVDQLRREKELNKVFYRFNEEEILFPPTYRYERGNRENYSHLKVKRTGIRINVPSWCDRVLWKSYPETHNVCMAYGCTDDIMTSDHSPVFCNIQVGVRGQYVSNEGLKSVSSPQSQPATILFESIEAILKSPGKTSFYLQFNSACLSASVKTGRNLKYDTTDIGSNCVRVIWERDALQQLQPIIADREYLVDQHLLVIIKDDDNESHAEFVLALRSMIGTSPQKFQEHLTRKGEDAGQIQGSMHVKTRDSTVSRKEKTYEFIQFGVGIRDEVPEAPMYSESSEINGRNWSGPPKVPSAMPTKMLNSTKGQVPPRSRPECRPPIAAPVATYQSMPANGPPTALYSDPDIHLRTSVPSSGSSSPQSNRETSPVFPARFPHPGSWQTPPNDSTHVDIGAFSGSPSRKSVSGASSQSLDAVIAEFEAAGSMFEAMGLDDNEQPHGSPIRHAYSANATGSLHGFPSVDTRRPMPSPILPPPRLPAPTPPSSRYPMTQPLIQQRPLIGQVSAPSFPPPPGPAPQLPGRIQSPKNSSSSVMSVQDMMGRLGLSQYTASLMQNGWDTIEFLSDVTDEDLQDCGVIVDQHRRAIMECVENLNYANL